MKKKHAVSKPRAKRASRAKLPDTLRPEYRFDYSKAKPNRFADRLSPDVVGVFLDPDVAAVFRSSEAVNSLLRSVIAAVPASKQGRGE
jgi:hypothetical protein